MLNEPVRFYPLKNAAAEDKARMNNYFPFFWMYGLARSIMERRHPGTFGKLSKVKPASNKTASKQGQ